MHNIKQIPKLRRSLDPVPALETFHPVTGLASRDLFDARIERQWNWCSETQRPMTMIIVEIEGGGDDIDEEELLSVALIVAETCRRRADFAGHIRPREFGLLLNDVDKDGAIKVAETLRDRISGGGDRYPKVSIGVGRCTPTANRFPKCIKIAVDGALQEAKMAGGGTYKVQELTH
ncbi:GGDEF domain-containing protein [bacterium]|nr:GGDEF domain-containing protein [bacterium]